MAIGSGYVARLTRAYVGRVCVGVADLHDRRSREDARRHPHWVPRSTSRPSPTNYLIAEWYFTGTKVTESK